jgi:alpha-tubulin suppressor-like RCC1 family protein
VPGLTDVVQVGAGRNVSLALLSDGTVWTWGAYCYSAEGGERATYDAPVMIEELSGVEAIHVHDMWCYALLGSGDILRWQAGGDSLVHGGGGAAERRMDIGFIRKLEGVEPGAGERNRELMREWTWSDTSPASRNHELPVIPEGRELVACASHRIHSLALDDAGDVWGRGDNRRGELGTGARSPREDDTVRMAAPGKVVAVVTDVFHSLVLIADAVPNTPPLAGDASFPAAAGEAVALRLPVLDREGGSVEIEIVSKPGHGRVERRGGEITYVADAGFTGDDRFAYRASDGELASEAAEILVHVLPAAMEGRLLGWGKNRNGQVGSGRFGDERLPVPVIGLRGVVRVGVGGEHAVALLEDGSVWCWGENDRGQLGDGTFEDRPCPTKVRGLPKARAVAAGFSFTVAALEDGSLRTWGWNSRGKLGDGGERDSNVPVAVEGLTGVVDVAAGEHVLALRDDGTVWGWGSNYRGHLGIGHGKRQRVPVRIEGLSDVVAVSAAGCVSLALDRGGNVWAWGLEGMAGRGEREDTVRPTRVESLSGIKAIAAGETASIALGNDGAVRIWGRNERARAGAFPRRVEGIADVVAIGAGYWHLIAMTADGGVWTWGLNGPGQLGDGGREPRGEPGLIGPLPRPRAIAAGGWNCFVVYDDDAVGAPAPVDDEF